MEDYMNSQTNIKHTYDWEKLIESEPLVTPIIDIIEDFDYYVIKVYMPGVSKNDIFLKLEEDILTVFGKVDLNHVEDEKFILREKSNGHYFRQFTISDKIDASRIEAKAENGILSIILPKHESIKPRVISIN